MKVINAVKNPNELIKYGLQLRKSNTQLNEPLGKPIGLVNHWSGVKQPNILFNPYHWHITQLGDEVFIIQTLAMSQKGQHLFGRNSNMVGISLCGVPSTITKYSVEQMGILNGELCFKYGINADSKILLPKKKLYNGSLINAGGMINFNAISDHAEFAKSDGYFPNRVDIGDLIDDVRKVAIETYKGLKSGTKKYTILDKLEG